MRHPYVKLRPQIAARLRAASLIGWLTNRSSWSRPLSASSSDVLMIEQRYDPNPPRCHGQAPADRRGTARPNPPGAVLPRGHRVAMAGRQVEEVAASARAAAARALAGCRLHPP